MNSDYEKVVEYHKDGLCISIYRVGMRYREYDEFMRRWSFDYLNLKQRIRYLVSEGWKQADEWQYAICDDYSDIWTLEEVNM